MTKSGKLRERTWRATSDCFVAAGAPTARVAAQERDAIGGTAVAPGQDLADRMIEGHFGAQT